MATIGEGKKRDTRACCQQKSNLWLPFKASNCFWKSIQSKTSLLCLLYVHTFWRQFLQGRGVKFLSCQILFLQKWWMYRKKKGKKRFFSLTWGPLHYIVLFDIWQLLLIVKIPFLLFFVCFELFSLRICTGKRQIMYFLYLNFYINWKFFTIDEKVDLSASKKNKQGLKIDSFATFFSFQNVQYTFSMLLLTYERGLNCRIIRLPMRVSKKVSLKGEFNSWIVISCPYFHALASGANCNNEYWVETCEVVWAGVFHASILQGDQVENQKYQFFPENIPTNNNCPNFLGYFSKEEIHNKNLAFSRTRGWLH